MLCVEKNNTRRTNAPSSLLDHCSQQEVMLRSGAVDFNYKLQCMFCEKEVNQESNYKHPDRHPSLSAMRKLHVVDTILSLADKRDDEGGRRVALRLGAVIDLVAAERRYHTQCFTYFSRLGSSLPGISVSHGRPLEAGKAAALQSLCNYIETNDECQYRISELISLMHEMDLSGDTYSEKYLKKNIIS